MRWYNIFNALVLAMGFVLGYLYKVWDIVPWIALSVMCFLILILSDEIVMKIHELRRNPKDQ